MDITIYLTLIIVIVGLFVLLRYSQTPFLYVGIIVLSALGLVLTVTSDAYITTGYTSTVTDSTFETFTVETTPIKQDLGAWQYILTLFYLSSLIGIIVFWTMEE